MTSPTSQSSGHATGGTGPPSTFLKQLLAEINGTTVPTVLRKQDARTAQKFSTRSTVTGEPSVWVGGATIAQDARVKLRAADEARFCANLSQRKDGVWDCRPRLKVVTSDLPLAQAEWNNDCPASSSSQSTATDLYLANFPVRAKPLLKSSNALNADLSPMFCNIESGTSSTPSPTDFGASPITADSTEPTIESRGLTSPQTGNGNSPGKRTWNGCDSREMLTKKMRTVTLPEQKVHSGIHLNLANYSSPDTLPDSCTIPAREFIAIDRSSTSPEQLCRPKICATPNPSSPEVDSTVLQYPPRPSTPVQISVHDSSLQAQTGAPSPPDTPSFARSFHLVNAGLSIYKQDHGDAWKDFPLCLYCFRQRGSFNRILTHGYEVCGGDYALKGHYWEGLDDHDSRSSL